MDTEFINYTGYHVPQHYFITWKPKKKKKPQQGKSDITHASSATNILNTAGHKD